MAVSTDLLPEAEPLVQLHRTAQRSLDLLQQPAELVDGVVAIGRKHNAIPSTMRTPKDHELVVPARERSFEAESAEASDEDPSGAG